MAGIAKLIHHNRKATISIKDKSILASEKTKTATDSLTNNFPNNNEGISVVIKNTVAIKLKSIMDGVSSPNALNSNKY